MTLKFLDFLQARVWTLLLDLVWAWTKPEHFTYVIKVGSSIHKLQNLACVESYVGGEFSSLLLRVETLTSFRISH